MRARSATACGVVLSTLAAFAVACSGGGGELAPNTQATVGQAVDVGFCDAAAVVAAKCVRCHSDPPAHGAPFPLTDYAAMTAPSPTASDPARTRADRMLAAVESGEMPFTALMLDPPVEPLSCEERTTLLTWLEGGAEPPADGDTTCTAHAPALLACDDTR